MPLTTSDIDRIYKTAAEEVAVERFREAVEKQKMEIKEKANRRWWKKIFPYRIKIERIT